MRPTEHEATVAVDAAARAAYDEEAARAREILPPEAAASIIEWDDLTALDKNDWRESVLKLVWAALAALPDRRRGAWEEGYHESFLNADAVNPYE